ncbi:hypothetical protein ZIOFF_004948 [Zingiber officinale]|uniref:Uncharacterized protein n=1 Tax=Zingiber officinale TaxID=94328 RepID=A0A8J5HUV5_ZINOF|nr:hypothetical protein ZIOFF_004948 [Zingiber officinale]
MDDDLELYKEIEEFERDLQVKSSPPPAQSTTINNDPTIIQSYYPHPASTSTSVSIIDSGGGADVNSHSGA